MKSLNKTLSLVLVLVMVLGLFGVAGAAFTDQNDAKYSEAVEVMTGIGAIDGYADGTIKPNGTITREEAAKLITFAILGKSVAEKLTVSATGFSDVDAGRWSAPYISYLVGEKIINGMGDGTFAPTEKVTGYQLAKMMLCAAGYGAKGEFTGNSWQLNVAVAAQKGKIFAGAVDVDYAKPATREEAMLYAFNGIVNVPQVSYNKLFDQYTNVTDAAGKTVEIAEEVYPTLKQMAVPGAVDGVASYRWMYKGQPISGAYDDATVLATSKNGTALALLTNNAKAEYIGYQPGESVKYFLNGDASTLAAVELEAVKNGVIVKFIDEGDDSKYDTVSVTKDTVSKVTGTPIIKTSGAITFITIPGITGLSSIDSTKVIGNTNVAKGDYVLWHKDAQGRFFLDGVCEKFTGTLNAFNAVGNVLVIDGTQYKVSGLGDTVATMGAYAGQANTVFYKDAAGFICKAVPESDVVDLKNVVYVIGSEAAGYAVQAFAAFPDGTVTAIPVAKVNGNTVATAMIGSAINKFYTFTKNENGSYNLKDLSAQYKSVNYGATAYAAGETIFTQGAANFLSGNPGSGYANNTTVLGTAKTQFVVNTGIGKYGAYTGIANAPTVKAKNPATAIADVHAAVLTDSDNYALFAVAYDNNKADAAAFDLVVSGVKGDAKYVFPVLPGTAIWDAKLGYSYYQFMAVVDGEIKTIDATGNAGGVVGGKGPLAPDVHGDLTVGMLTTVDTYDNGRVASTKDDGGYIDGTTFANVDGSAANKVATKFAVNGSTVTAYLGDTPRASFIVDANAKIFIFDATNPKDPKIAVSSLEELATLAGYNEVYALQGVKKGTDNSAITQLYVTKADATQTPVVNTDGIFVYNKTADAYAVHYYGAAPTSDAIFAAVNAQIAKDGYTVKSIAEAAGTYTFTLTKTVGGVPVTAEKTFAVADVAKVYKVTLAALANSSATDFDKIALNGLTVKAGTNAAFVVDGSIYVPATGGTLVLAVKNEAMATATTVTITAADGTLAATTITLANNAVAGTTNKDVVLTGATDDVVITATVSNT